MLILFGAGEKYFLKKDFPEFTDPLGGGQGITIAVMQRYVTIGDIPVSGTRKMAKAFSNESGQPIPVLLWTDDMRRTGDRLLSQTNGAWKRRLIAQVFGWALLLSVFYIILSASLNSRSAKWQDVYRTNPQAGDMVLAKEIISHYKKNASDPSSLIVFKIEQLSGDSMIIRRSRQKVDFMELYRTKNKNKLVGLFDLSDTVFQHEAEVFSLHQYRKGSERLRPIRLENLPYEERKVQDSIINYTDIIEPIFIKRPKK